jgi:hypothetical protein
VHALNGVPACDQLRTLIAIRFCRQGAVRDGRPHHVVFALTELCLDLGLAVGKGEPRRAGSNLILGGLPICIHETVRPRGRATTDEFAYV